MSNFRRQRRIFRSGGRPPTDGHDPFTLISGLFDINGAYAVYRADNVVTSSGVPLTASDLTGNGNDLTLVRDNTNSPTNTGLGYSPSNSEFNSQPTFNFTGSQARHLYRDGIAGHGVAASYSMVAIFRQPAERSSLLGIGENRGPTTSLLNESVGFRYNVSTGFTHWLISDLVGPDAATYSPSASQGFISGAVCLIGTYDDDANEVKLYENGVLVAQTMSASIVLPAPSKIIVGARRTDQDSWIDMELAEIGWFNAALTPVEIEDIKSYTIVRYGTPDGVSSSRGGL